MGDWQNIKLIRLAEFINGYGFKPADWSKEGLPIIRIEQIKNPDAQYDFYNGILPAYNIIDDGDLIFSWSASLFLKIWDRGKAALNQHLFKVVPNCNTDKLFLKYLIEYNLPALLISAHGSTMQHITRKELDKFNVNIPIEKSEQAQIASIINSVDKAMTQIEKLIFKNQRIKAGLMQNLLTRGIDENGNIRSEKSHTFKTERGLRVPEDWEVKTLEELTRSTITYGIVQAGPDIQDGIPYIRTGDMSGDYLTSEGLLKTTKEIAANYLRSRVEENDIVFALRATIGKVLIVPKELHGANLTQGTARIAPNWNLIGSCFLLWSMRMDYFKNQILQVQKGTTFFEISLGELRQMIIAYPRNINEQKKIATIINNQESLIQRKISNLNKLQSLKTGIMQDLLSGKVRVAT